MKERVISAVVALLITVPLILLGGNYFVILVIILGLLGLKELLNLLKGVPYPVKIISYLLFVILLLFGYQFIDGIYIMNFSLMLITFLIVLTSIILYSNRKEYSISDAFFLISSLIFLSSAFNLFIIVREKSLMLTIYLFLVTTMTDTFAYVLGSKIGKRKLIPKISPNKSVEGFIAGLIFGTIIASTFYCLCIDSSNIIMIILMTIILSIIGQCGDLVFSAIKRHYKIKDFSNIMPGHGGILDRLDSIIFVLFGYIIFSVIL